MTRTAPSIEIHLLGTPTIKVAGTALGFPYEKPKLLCAYLITEGKPHYRHHLARLLWPGRSALHSRQNLRQAIATLKRLLGTAFDELFILTRHTVEFIGQGRCTVDIELLKDTAQTSSNSTMTPAGQGPISYFYPGPFCQGLNNGDCQEFDEWLHARRLEFQSLAITLSRKLLNASKIAGDERLVMETYTQMIAIDRHNESLVGEFMEYLATQGRRLQALTLYREHEKNLRQEHDVQPSSHLVALHQTLTND